MIETNWTSTQVVENKIVFEYTIVVMSDLEKFPQAVADWVSKGFKLEGGVSITHDPKHGLVCAQALVRIP